MNNKLVADVGSAWMATIRILTMNAPNAKIIVSNADITITLFSTKVMEIVINARNGGRQLFSDNVSSEIQKSLF